MTEFTELCKDGAVSHPCRGISLLDHSLCKGDVQYFETTAKDLMDFLACLLHVSQNEFEDNARAEAQDGMTQGDKLNALKTRRRTCSSTAGAPR